MITKAPINAYTNPIINPTNAPAQLTLYPNEPQKVKAINSAALELPYNPLSVVKKTTIAITIPVAKPALTELNSLYLFTTILLFLKKKGLYKGFDDKYY